VLAALYLIALVVDPLDVQCSYTDRDDAKDEQFALNRLPLAPTFRKWGTNRHEPSQRPNHMTVKGAFLHFVSCFGRGAIQCRRDINYHCLARRTGAALIAPALGGQTRVAVMRVLTCGSFSIPQRRRRRLSSRSARKCFCAIRRNFSSISASVIGFLKCPR
jgi:hypothetical protein